MANQKRRLGLDATEKIFNNSRESFLDVLRAMACISVFFYHQALNVYIGDVPIYGYHGVHLFFVISGYLLGGRYVTAIEKASGVPEPVG
jgi:peptidoglycan/LPS O-acetylase OafA/YrhL